MKPLYTPKEFFNCKSNGKLLCKCYECGNPFLKDKRSIVTFLNGTATKGCAIKYCSSYCRNHSLKKANSHTWTQVQCKSCKKQFTKPTRHLKRSPNHFCSSSCSTTYGNTHKKYGIKRSKLELWLEQQLPILYPYTEFHFARKDAINSELDIYIPSLKLAFELNGIFHYEPIFGPDQLAKIQNNDQRKHQACIEKGIELCIIDVSSLNYFKTEKAEKYLDIITSIINTKY